MTDKERMFTGIITDVGRIEAVETRGDLRVRIGCGYDMADVDLGASIACSGVCLTVVDKGDGWFAVDVSGETQRRTAPAMWTEGKRLNLERALRIGDELGGHIVTGHVDGIGEVTAADSIGDSTRIDISAGPEIASYVATKGSIALDGVSLTVNGVQAAADGGIGFSVNIIPHTAAQTSFSDVAAGQSINIEIDVLARYLGRLLEVRASSM
jgi:riboflavin synthase